MNYTLSFMGRAFNRFSPHQPSSSTTRWKEGGFTVNPRQALPFFLSILMEFLNLHVSFDVVNEISEFPYNFPSLLTV